MANTYVGNIVTALIFTCFTTCAPAVPAEDSRGYQYIGTMADNAENSSVRVVPTPHEKTAAFVEYVNKDVPGGGPYTELNFYVDGVGTVVVVVRVTQNGEYGCCPDTFEIKELPLGFYAYPMTQVIVEENSMGFIDIYKGDLS